MSQFTTGRHFDYSRLLQKKRAVFMQYTSLVIRSNKVTSEPMAVMIVLWRTNYAGEFFQKWLILSFVISVPCLLDQWG